MPCECLLRELQRRVSADELVALVGRHPVPSVFDDSDGTAVAAADPEEGADLAPEHRLRRRERRGVGLGYGRLSRLGLAAPGWGRFSAAELQLEVLWRHGTFPVDWSSTPGTGASVERTLRRRWNGYNPSSECKPDRWSEAGGCQETSRSVPPSFFNIGTAVWLPAQVAASGWCFVSRDDLRDWDGFQAQPGAHENVGMDLCQRFVRALPVDGASISVVARSGQESVIGATDSLAAQLEAWQFEFGEGPHVQALKSGRPVLVDDLRSGSAAAAWPILQGEAVKAGAAALFAIPLHLGTATVGVVDLYSSTIREAWSDEVVEAAVGIADGTAPPALRLATRSAQSEDGAATSSGVELRREVHQATGMVLMQLDSDASTALARMRAHAFASGVPLERLALDVIQGRIDFSTIGG